MRLRTRDEEPVRGPFLHDPPTQRSRWLAGLARDGERYLG
jgi:hypothetical protein